MGKESNYALLCMCHKFSCETNHSKDKESLRQKEYDVIFDEWQTVPQTPTTPRATYSPHTTANTYPSAIGELEGLPPSLIRMVWYQPLYSFFLDSTFLGKKNYSTWNHLYYFSGTSQSFKIRTSQQVHLYVAHLPHKRKLFNNHPDYTYKGWFGNSI